MCVNRSVPETAGARFVVSLIGDILSPKYAPEIIAPAIKPVFISIAWPMPSKATPIVAIVVHELPVASEIIALTMQAANRNMVGFNILSP